MKNDTIKLLKKCNSGAKTALNTLELMLVHAGGLEFKSTLIDYISQHHNLIDESNSMLANAHESGKDPTKVARFMARTTTENRLKKDSSDSNISKMIIFGCDKGIEMTFNYKKQFSRSNADSQMFANKLVTLEQNLRQTLQRYV
ncbi:MAG: hypothetical protein RR416_06190 [Clostridia bacterium]